MNIETAAVIIDDVIVLQLVLEACRRTLPWRSALPPLALLWADKSSPSACGFQYQLNGNSPPVFADQRRQGTISSSTVRVSHNLPVCWPLCAPITDMKNGKGSRSWRFRNRLSHTRFWSGTDQEYNPGFQTKFEYLLPKNVSCITHKSHLVKSSIIILILSD